MNRIGGAGCPNCGSHNTSGLSGRRERLCHSCDNRWRPCSPHCRGYTLEYHPPRVKGCAGCGVPTGFAECWPEAHRQLALSMAKFYPKLEPIKMTVRVS